MTAAWTDHPPLVGRHKELRVLDGLLDELRAGRGGVVLISGEPGIGKSRVLLEVAQHAHAARCRVLVGRAYESEGLPPYLPFVDALRDYLRTCRPEQVHAYLEHGAADLVGFVPEWSAYADPESPSSKTAGASRDPEGDRYRLFESLCRVLINISEAAESGLLLCLDDLHWADPPTLQLLLHLARKLDEAPILVATTYRTTTSDLGRPLQDALAELSRERIRQRLTLTALTREECARLVVDLGGETSASNLDAIHSRTGGNPFFTRELVRHLHDQGVDLAHPSAANADWGVPQGVHQVIGRRLSRLSQDTNRLLQAAAVLGEPLLFNVLSEMLGMAPPVLLDAIDEAIRAGLLREERDQYMFSHALVRETLYRGLSLARRQQLHLDAARALETVYIGAIERHLGELARHMAAAGDLADVDRSIDYADRAGDAAVAL
ncbi:MAG TPA: AAA family ATPase, partial [Chloroflexota bacterium]|nr:AAA family ATPase [Chloroflexota bacterium]